MYLSLFQAALAASTISTASAFRDVSFPSTAAADTDVQLQINNDLSSSSGFDHQFDSFRIYLATTPPGLGANPACYLVNSSAINTTSLTFQIPASVGPEGTAYSVATEEFNQDSKYGTGSSDYEFSGTFDLTNATGSWSEYELAGYLIGDADVVPCTAYDCARNCSQTFYPDNTNTTAGAKQTFDCIVACPGVQLPGEWNSSSPTASTTSSATAMNTGTPTTTKSTVTPTPKNGAGQQVLGTTGLVAVMLGVFGVLGL